MTSIKYKAKETINHIIQKPFEVKIRILDVMHVKSRTSIVEAEV